MQAFGYTSELVQLIWHWNFVVWVSMMSLIFFPPRPSHEDEAFLTSQKHPSLTYPDGLHITVPASAYALSIHFFSSLIKRQLLLWEIVKILQLLDLQMRSHLSILMLSILSPSELQWALFFITYLYGVGRQSFFTFGFGTQSPHPPLELM